MSFQWSPGSLFTMCQLHVNIVMTRIPADIFINSFQYWFLIYDRIEVRIGTIDTYLINITNYINLSHQDQTLNCNGS